MIGVNFPTQPDPVPRPSTNPILAYHVPKPGPISTSVPSSPSINNSSNPGTAPGQYQSFTMCFSGANTVEVKDVGHVPMNLLGIGDLVKSRDDMFTQVYGFGHFDHNLEGTFLHISFENNDTRQTIPSPVSSLEISSRHLVMVEKDNKNYRIPAANVVVGDILSGQRVHTIQNVVRRGVYAPLTQSGEIIVSGILSSNYVNLLDLAMVQDQHTIGHLLFTSQRFFCRYFIATCKNERYVDGYGLLAYLLVTSTTLIHHGQTMFVTTFKLHRTMMFYSKRLVPFIMIVALVRVTRRKLKE
jgi:Hint module